MTTPAWNPWVRARKATAGVETVAGAFNSGARVAQAGGESGGNPGAGLTGVAAEDDFGLRCCVVQRMGEGEADGEDGGGVEGGLAGDGADAVGAEEFARG